MSSSTAAVSSSLSLYLRCKTFSLFPSHSTSSQFSFPKSNISPLKSLSIKCTANDDSNDLPIELKYAAFPTVMDINQIREILPHREISQTYFNPRASNISSSSQWKFSKFLTQVQGKNKQESKPTEPLMGTTSVLSPLGLFGRRIIPFPMHHNTFNNQMRCMSNNTSIELKMENDGIKFSTGEQPLQKKRHLTKGDMKEKKFKRSKKAKLNELRFFRLKAKRKMKSPDPEVRIRYKLDKAKRKEEWLIEKLRKFEIPKGSAETYDPEILTEEEKFYLKRTGEKKKNYVPVGRRGVFGGVVLNMHLHWKKHETVKVVCKPCRPGQIHEYADELARLSKGIVIDIKPNNTVIFYRGKNYVQPMVMSPVDTLSKSKALEKYQFGQSLEHTSQFIEKLEQEYEEYQKHLARYKKEKETKIKQTPC